MIEETQNKFSFVIVPENLDTVQKLIEDITVMRKCLLEASMFAMTEQQTLIQLLNEMRENNLYDSRPSYKRQELEEMIEYIGSFLERLQDKRRRLLILFQKRKKELESLHQYMKYTQELEKVSELNVSIGYLSENITQIFHVNQFFTIPFFLLFD